MHCQALEYKKSDSKIKGLQQITEMAKLNRNEECQREKWEKEVGNMAADWNLQSNALKKIVGLKNRKLRYMDTWLG